MSGREEIRDRLHDHLCHGLGEPVLDALTRKGVTDIDLPEDDGLWVNEHGVWVRDPNAHYSPEQRESIIGLVANSLHQEATFANPIIEGEVTIKSRRYRFTGHLPPISTAPTAIIRKPAEIVYTLADYERDGIITREQHKFLQKAVIDRKKHPHRRRDGQRQIDAGQCSNRCNPARSEGWNGRRHI
jgi:type IV secretion system protein TrbB